MMDPRNYTKVGDDLVEVVLPEKLIWALSVMADHKVNIHGYDRGFTISDAIKFAEGLERPS